MKIEDNSVIFNTGTKLCISSGIIGLRLTPGEVDVFYGYGGNLSNGRIHEFKPVLTPEECVELAEYMMDTWESFLVYHRKIVNESVPPSTAY